MEYPKVATTDYRSGRLMVSMTEVKMVDLRVRLMEDLKAVMTECHLERPRA